MEVPAKSIAIIEAKTSHKGDLIVVPWQQQGLHIANSISTVTDDQKVDLLVLNQSEKPTLLHQNTQVASYEVLETIPEVVPEEVKSILEIGNTSSTVRIGDNPNPEQVKDLQGGPKLPGTKVFRGS